MNEPFHKDMLDRSRRDRPLYLQVYEILQTHIRDMRNSGNADSRRKNKLRTSHTPMQTMSAAGLVISDMNGGADRKNGRIDA